MCSYKTDCPCFCKVSWQFLTADQISSSYKLVVFGVRTSCTGVTVAQLYRHGHHDEAHICYTCMQFETVLMKGSAKRLNQDHIKWVSCSETSKVP